MDSISRTKSSLAMNMGLDEQNESKPDPRIFRVDLYNAVMKNDTNTTLAFLLDKVPCDYVDKKSRFTCLHWAALHGNVIVVRKLLEAGASSFYQKARGRLPLDNSRWYKPSEIVAMATDTIDAVDEEKGTDDNDSDEDSIKGIDNRDETENSSNDLGIDFRKNTPLLWASYKGHFEIVWLLLLDGYSSNDTDDNGNNALHLAAVGGHTKIVKTLIDDGANANLVNTYKNLPIDMAYVKEIREMLANAMEKYASNTTDDIRIMNRQNIKQYKELIQDLKRDIKDHSSFESKSADAISSAVKSLEERLQVSKEWDLDANLVRQGEQLVQKMEAVLDLISDINALRAVLPLTTQADYTKYVVSLERSAKVAEGLNVDRNRIIIAKNLILQSQAEYWVSNCINRLKDVSCADDEHEHDIQMLKRAIDKYETRPCSSNLIETGRSLHLRLSSELGMVRSIRNIPVVCLPIEKPPVGYWQPSDIGKIRETPEYPNPPAEPPGEYIWEPSLSYASMKDAISRLREYIDSAVLSSANAALTSTAKDRLAKAEKDFKLLENKNTTDKTSAIEAVIKLAKKLKKKKKKAAMAANTSAANAQIKSPTAGAISESDNEAE